MRSPLAAWRDFRSTFTAVMREHEEFLLDQLAPADHEVEAARASRAAASGRVAPGSPTPSPSTSNSQD